MALIDHRAIANWKPNARPADGWPFLSKEKLQELRESGSRASRAQDIVLGGLGVRQQIALDEVDCALAKRGELRIRALLIDFNAIGLLYLTNFDGIGVEVTDRGFTAGDMLGETAPRESRQQSCEVSRKTIPCSVM
jgi:hypothetical protein